LLLPKLESIKDKYKKSLQIFLVNTNDFDDKNKLIDFLNNYNHTECMFDGNTNQYNENKSKDYYKPLTIPILFADKIQKQRYGVTAFPATIIVDKKGIVYTGMIGYFEEYEE
jgi:hypothetical protein